MLTPLHTPPAGLAGQLVAFRIANGGLAAKRLPKRLKLLNWGVNQTIKGPVTVGEQTVALLAENQARLGYDRIQIDFNHQTVPGSDTFQADPVEVAAYGTPVVIPGDGLYLDHIAWTPAGEKYASNYHDLSPTPKLDEQGEVVFLHSVALCRQGAVKDLTFYSNTFLKPLRTPPVKNNAPTAPQDDAVDYRGLLVALLQKLGVEIPDTSTDADIATMVDQFKTPDAAAGDADPNAPRPPASARTTSYEARLDRMERDHLLTLAASQGKAVPLSAAEIAATPLGLLRGLIDKLPSGAVPLSARQGGNPAKPHEPGRIATLTAGQKLIVQNLGVSEEKYLAHLNAEKTTAATIL